MTPRFALVSFAGTLRKVEATVDKPSVKIGIPMRIAEVRAHILEAKLSQPFAWSFNSTDTRTSCLVEIVAEDGTSGWGECFGPARLNAAVVRAMSANL